MLRIPICVIATAWFVNGLICNVLDPASRHEQIVGRIPSKQLESPPQPQATLNQPVPAAEMRVLWGLTAVEAASTRPMLKRALIHKATDNTWITGEINRSKHLSIQYGTGTDNG